MLPLGKGTYLHVLSGWDVTRVHADYATTSH